MNKIKIRILNLSKDIYYNCDDNALLEELYIYLFKLIMNFECLEDGNTLASAFCFIKNGKKQHARAEYNMMKFFRNFDYDLDNVIINFDDGYGIGASADIPDFIRIRLNSNEGKHLESPHVHISRAYKDKPYCRINLTTLTPMKGEEKIWMELFSNPERQNIIRCLLINKNSLIDQYHRITKGEYIKKEYTITYKDKKYVIG